MDNRPHLTVACVIHRKGKFLMVRERNGGSMVYNQPAGHVEYGETVLDAAARETLEETAWEVHIEAYLGVYQHTSETNGITYVRHCFIAEPLRHYAERTLDPDIHDALWLSRSELENLQDSLRSPMVLRAIEDFHLGIRYPLSLFRI